MEDGVGVTSSSMNSASVLSSSQVKQVVHPVRGNLQLASQFLAGRLAAELLHQALSYPMQLVEFVYDVRGQANSATLISHSSQNRLADPPGSVGAETVSSVRIEPFHSFDQPQVALLHQIR